MVETFLIESWLEHIRQHERVTNADRVLQDAVLAFLCEGPPVIRHLVAAEPEAVTPPPGQTRQSQSGQQRHDVRINHVRNDADDLRAASRPGVSDAERHWRSSACAVSARLAPSQPARRSPGSARSAGLSIVLSGEIEVTRYTVPGRRAPIVTHGPGAFLGELAQLAGRPALVDAKAQRTGRGPDHPAGPAARAADRGSGARRAHHAGADPAPRRSARDRRRRAVIVGRADNGDVLRLREFLRRNGHPNQTLDPETDRGSQGADRALSRRSRPIADRAVPGRPAAAQSDRGRACALHRAWSAPIDPDRIFDVVMVGAGPAGLAAAVYAGSEGLRALGARLPRLRRAGRRLGADRELLGFPTGISGMALMARAYSQAQKFGVEMAIPDEAISARYRRRLAHDGRFVLHWPMASA